MQPFSNKADCVTDSRKASFVREYYLVIVDIQIRNIFSLLCCVQLMTLKIVTTMLTSEQGTLLNDYLEFANLEFQF